MKNKKKSASKKSWVVDCRTDSAFDFALTVLREAKNQKYPLVVRANFAKIAFSNSCEAIARVQADRSTNQLPSAIKLFNRNLKEICNVCKRFNMDNESSSLIKEKIITNPYNYIEIDYESIESVINNKNVSIDWDKNNVLVDYVHEYEYPRIYERAAKTNMVDTKLLPTNDIVVTIPHFMINAFGIARPHMNRDVISEVTFIKDFISDTALSNMSKLIHTPYDSFTSIESLIYYAASSPDKVDEISITAYRLGDNSEIVNDIILATKNGIKCNFYIELNARGEVWRDIDYISRILKNADRTKINIRIHYNESKVHGKMIYIKMKNNKSIGIFSTGNYNSDTANFYKDYHYITNNQSVISLIQRNFSILWNSDQPVLSSISNILSKEIYTEIEKGKKGRIWIQSNHLDNVHIVGLLKEAEKRGCDVKLIIRTTKGYHKKDLKYCKTVVGPYLEHARVYIFGTKSESRVYLSSSDILYRNLYNRFESYVKIPTDDQSTINKLENDFSKLYKNGQQM